MASTAPIQVLSMLSDGESRLALQALSDKNPAISIVAGANSQTEAMQQLSEKHVDVVLLDLALQNVDGIALTRQIRQSHPTVRVLISTAFRRASDIFAVMDAGADGYVLKGNDKGLEVAISTVRLGAVWLDPGIATQVLEAMVSETSLGKAPTRTLPTGRMPIPLWPHEKELLNKVATSDCVDGVCMVDPGFVKKLRQFAAAQQQSF